jgi:hypothetical protein
VASFHFEDTAMWQAVRDDVDRQRISLRPAQIRAILQELVFTGRYPAIARQALAHVLAEQEMPGGMPEDRDLAAAAERFRRANKLLTAGAVRAWLDQRGMTHADYVRAILDEDALDRLAESRAAALETKILELLRRWGEVDGLLAAANSRFAALSACAAAAQNSHSKA